MAFPKPMVEIGARTTQFQSEMRNARGEITKMDRDVRTMGTTMQTRSEQGRAALQKMSTQAARTQVDIKGLSLSMVGLATTTVGVVTSLSNLDRAAARVEKSHIAVRRVEDQIASTRLRLNKLTEQGKQGTQDYIVQQERLTTAMSDLEVKQQDVKLAQDALNDTQILFATTIINTGINSMFLLRSALQGMTLAQLKATIQTTLFGAAQTKTTGAMGAMSTATAVQTGLVWKLVAAMRALSTSNAILLGATIASTVAIAAFNADIGLMQTKSREAAKGNEVLTAVIDAVTFKFLDAKDAMSEFGKGAEGAAGATGKVTGELQELLDTIGSPNESPMVRFWSVVKLQQEGIIGQLKEIKSLQSGITSGGGGSGVGLTGGGGVNRPSTATLGGGQTTVGRGASVGGGGTTVGVGGVAGGGSISTSSSGGAGVSSTLLAGSFGGLAGTAAASAVESVGGDPLSVVTGISGLTGFAIGAGIGGGSTVGVGGVAGGGAISSGEGGISLQTLSIDSFAGQFNKAKRLAEQRERFAGLGGLFQQGPPAPARLTANIPLSASEALIAENNPVLGTIIAATRQGIISESLVQNAVLNPQAANEIAIRLGLTPNIVLAEFGHSVSPMGLGIEFNEPASLRALHTSGITLSREDRRILKDIRIARQGGQDNLFRDTASLNNRDFVKRVTGLDIGAVAGSVSRNDALRIGMLEMELGQFNAPNRTGRLNTAFIKPNQSDVLRGFNLFHQRHSVSNVAGIGGRADEVLAMLGGNATEAFQVPRGSVSVPQQYAIARKAKDAFFKSVEGLRAIQLGSTISSASLAVREFFGEEITRRPRFVLGRTAGDLQAAGRGLPSGFLEDVGFAIEAGLIDLGDIVNLPVGKERGNALRAITKRFEDQFVTSEAIRSATSIFLNKNNLLLSTNILGLSGGRRRLEFFRRNRLNNIKMIGRLREFTQRVREGRPITVDQVRGFATRFLDESRLDETLETLQTDIQREFFRDNIDTRNEVLELEARAYFIEREEATSLA